MRRAAWSQLRRWHAASDRRRILAPMADAGVSVTVRSGTSIRPLERYCCAGESRRAVRHHLREHDPGIDIPLWCKPPIDSGGDRVERSAAVRVLGADAGGEP